jgi:MraZ protein
LYSKEQWQKMAEKLGSLPTGQAKARAFARHMIAGAMDVEFDSQGRITLPEYLRNFADLEKKTIVAGLYNHLEIWDEKAWDKYKKQAEKNSNDIAESLGDLGV